MTEVRQLQAKVAKTRKLPLTPELVAVLEAGGEAAGIDAIEVTSGGQYEKGKGPRTGSDRHDHGNAADLSLVKGGRKLNFESTRDRPTVEAFVTAVAARGATGIGAGVAYMGPYTLHIGFGSRLTWGAGGKAANAPKWLRAAAEKGWANPVPTYPTLKRGDKGEPVKIMQRCLAAHGHTPGEVDGDFGERSETALKRFQSIKALLPDGVCGPKTWSALLDT